MLARPDEWTPAVNDDTSSDAPAPATRDPRRSSAPATVLGAHTGSITVLGAARSRRGEPHTGPEVRLPSRDEAGGVRLVAVDLDGTLLDDDGEVPDGMWRVAEALRARGITLTLASGRQYATLAHTFERAAEGMVFLAENGAFAVRDGAELFSEPLDDAVVRDAVRIARGVNERGADCGAVLCGTRSAYVERSDDRFIEAARPYYRNLETVPDLLAADGPLTRDEIVKVATYELDDAEAEVLPALRELEDRAQVVLSSRHWVDLMARGVNKGTALRRLQAELGVTRDETMAFGDYGNDLEMLAEARYAIAMANAHDDVLRACTFVAPPNTERGVLRALDHALGLGLGIADGATGGGR